MKGRAFEDRSAISDSVNLRLDSRQIAFWLLVAFLLAVLAALIVTIWSVPPTVRLLAGAVVVPIVAVTVLLLYFERRGRRWSFAGAAVLGVLGVTLRLIVNSRPSLEVGGGLPIEVTVAYVALGLAVAGTSLWASLP